jgi:hypothetical protein
MKSITIKGPVTYRKVVSRGFTPVWYKTNHGSVAAYIITRGRKWMKIGFSDGRTRRVKLTEERYMTEWVNRSGGVA